MYGLPIALIAILMGFFFAAFNPSGWLNEGLIALGLIGALAGTLLNVLGELPQTSGTVINIVIVVLDVAWVVMAVRLYFLGQIVLSIRTKLIMGALLITVAPIIVLSIVNVGTLTSVSQTQSNESLRMATQISIDQIDSFFNTNLITLQSEASLPSVIAYLETSPDMREGSLQEKQLSATLTTLKTKESLYAPSYGIINLLGINIFDTEPLMKGKSELNTYYFEESAGTKSAFVSSIEFIPNSRDAYIYFIAPISNESKEVIGYLRLRYDARIIQDKLLKVAGIIGSHSYPILIDDNGMRVADASDPSLLYHSILPLSNAKYQSLVSQNLIPSYIPQGQIVSEIPEVSAAVFNNESEAYEVFTVDLQTAQTGIPDAATYARVSTQYWYLVYLQEQTTLVSSLETLTKSAVQLAVFIAALVSFLVTIFSNLFTQPILGLTQTAEKVAIGDFTAQANTRSKDEIGSLARSFNTMTEQLRGSIENLEKRVQDRTQMLAKQNESLTYRSRQLQTVADVARNVVSNTNLESLLTSVTNLISDRFNYYHVGIFLIDDAGEYAVLRASNSVGGQRMLSRQHKLRVGQVGIVGNVTGAGVPRIATDVGKDAVFFNNPDLPETKSEMALPLKIENNVIGALDIQSIESNAFSEDDVALFSTLADQISVAINNNRLLADTAQALEEAQTLHRQYLNQEWTKQAQQEASNNYKYTPQGLIPFEEKLPEIDLVFNSGRPITKSYPISDRGGKPHSVLAVPINLRGETIGVIHLQVNEGNEFTWSENELLTVQTVADQVAQTLESARLFEQTIRRADRERRVLEITSKIRSTNDPQEMLQITLEELKRHLGASQAQIVINMPNNSSDSNPGSSQNDPQRG
ncbi:hypothetical protein SDC9_72076 [bioreactor metagenome]|uniref:histidine kinase n=1 Tax=bioreactor metagenome TaxID=1076179 RepID=A0A644YAR4_9ZZZZ